VAQALIDYSLGSLNSLAFLFG